MNGEKVLEVKDLSYSVKNQQILKNVSLSVGKSEIVGLLGPSGSGKTTLLKHIVGTLPAKNKIFFLGKEAPYKEMFAKTGYMLQSDALYEDLSCIDNMIFFTKIYGVKNGLEKSMEILELCKLTEHKDKIVSNFSGGMKRRLSLAIALINNPSMLVLDEPTVGIDPVLREAFWEFFFKIKNEGVSIIITTHIMSDAEKCDNLFILSDGEIVSEGSAEFLKKNTDSKDMEEVYSKVSKKRLQ